MHFIGMLAALALTSWVASFRAFAGGLQTLDRILVTGFLVAVGVRLALVPYVRAAPIQSSDFFNATGLTEWVYAWGLTFVCVGCAVFSTECLARLEPLPKGRLAQSGRAFLTALLSCLLATVVAALLMTAIRVRERANYVWTVFPIERRNG